MLGGRHAHFARFVKGQLQSNELKFGSLLGKNFVSDAVWRDKIAELETDVIAAVFCWAHTGLYVLPEPSNDPASHLTSNGS